MSAGLFDLSQVLNLLPLIFVSKFLVAPQNFILGLRTVTVIIFCARRLCNDTALWDILDYSDAKWFSEKKKLKSRSHTALN